MNSRRGHRVIRTLVTVLGVTGLAAGCGQAQPRATTAVPTTGVPVTVPATTAVSTPASGDRVAAKETRDRLHLDAAPPDVTPRLDRAGVVAALAAFSPGFAAQAQSRADTIVRFGAVVPDGDFYADFIGRKVPARASASGPATTVWEVVIPDIMTPGSLGGDGQRSEMTWVIDDATATVLFELTYGYQGSK